MANIGPGGGIRVANIG